MEKVLVTGATGRLGMNLVKALVEKGYKVKSFCYDTPAEENLRKKLREFDTEIVIGDLSTGKGIEEAVKDIDSVIHCAALMQEDRAPRDKFFDINTKGAFYLMEGIKGKKIRRFVGITTGAVYDLYTAKPPYNEDNTPTKPLSLYGLCKILNEKIYLNYAFVYDIPVIILRPNYILAGSEAAEIWGGSVLLSVMKKYCKDRRTIFYTEQEHPWQPLEEAINEGYKFVIPYGPGRKSWSWHTTDVRDVVKGCILALETENKEAIGEIFNIASEKPQKYSEVIPYLCEKLGEKYKEVELPVGWYVEFDISKAKRLLNYTPEYDYKRMIDDAIRFKNGEDTGVIGPGIPH